MAKGGIAGKGGGVIRAQRGTAARRRRPRKLNKINFKGVARYGPYGLEYHSKPGAPYRPAVLNDLAKQINYFEAEGLPLAALTDSPADDIFGERMLVEMWQKVLNIRRSHRYKFSPADIGEAATNLKSHQDALKDLLAPPDVTTPDTPPP
jgi:hypothetical protein